MMSAVRRLSVIAVCLALCGVVWAGNVQVTVSDALTPVSGANVKINPDGLTGTTNAAGKWNATGVTAGDALVMAWTDVGGTLKGAVAEVTVPAHGTVSVDLSLVRAIWFHRYWPLAVGNTWQYEYRHSGDDGTWRRVWHETVDRSVVVDGASAVVIRGEWAGGPVEWEETRACNSEGFFMYDQQHGTDTITFDPPMHIPDLLPLGYEYAVTCVAHHSDGSPDSPASMSVKLARFEDVRVPAGLFRDAPRLDVEMTLGSETNQITVWFARNIGIVREIEKNEVRTNEKLLQEYRLRGLPMVRPIKPLRPIRPRLP